MTNKVPLDFVHLHGPFCTAAWYIDNNQHTEAVKSIADYHGLTSHSNVFAGILLIQQEEGSIPPALIELRDKWTKFLKNWVNSNATPDNKRYLRGLL